MGFVFAFSLRLHVEHVMVRMHFGFLSLPDLGWTPDVVSQKEGDGVGVHSGRVPTLGVDIRYVGSLSLFVSP